LFDEPSWPFLKKGVLSELRSAKKEGLMAISDLDFEYEMGKLTQDDYIFLRDNLKSEVSPVLKKEMEITGNRILKQVDSSSNNLTPNLLREVIRICSLRRSS
jgi:hypothetical protein